MIDHWKALDLEITDGEDQFDRTYTGKTIQSQTLNLEHVEIIKIWDKHTYDTSFESYWHGDYRFWISLWNYTISNLKPLNM